MSKFKENDNIERACNDAKWARIGFKAVVLKGNLYLDALGGINEILDEYWKLVKPKWTIYNNVIPWSKLTNVKKGKLLLAGNEGVEITLDGDIVNDAAFKCKKGVYKAIKPEPVKPESKMANLLMVDLSQCHDGDLISHLINRGWNKPCK